MGLRNKIKGFIGMYPDSTRDELADFLLKNHIEIGDIVEVTSKYENILPGIPLHVQKITESVKGYTLHCKKFDIHSDVDINMIPRKITKRVIL